VIQEKLFEIIYQKSKQSTQLQEMAVHCRKTDGFGMIIVIGTGFGKGKTQLKEHNPPHAHIWSLDKTFESRFRIDEENVPTKENLQTVSENDKPLGKYAEKNSRMG
jgi:hypothetical protein